MSRHTPAAVVALTALVVVGLLFPAGSVAGVFAGQSDSGVTDQQSGGTAVSVEVGEQLSTVVETTSTGIRTEAESVGFEQRLDSANATERASLIAERARELENRSAELRAKYNRVTTAYQQDEITTNEYARQIATLAAGATNVERSTDRLQKQARTLSTAERRAVGVTDNNLAEITDGINPLTGATASAVLGRFTAENSGEISIEVGDRIEVSVESNGERSRQFERPRTDDDDTYTVNQSAALAVAEEQLSGGPAAWALRGVSTEDGAYEFEFQYLGPGEGEADVSVDGSSGTVFALEESIEAPEDDDDESEELDDLVVRVVSGDAAPGANVTLLVTGNGAPVGNATVRIDDEPVGETGPEGQIDVTLPNSDEIEITATAGDADGELDFEFEDEDEDRELGATASIDGQTVTVSVLRGGQPLEGATVTLNEEVTETTNADGQASFTFSDSELEIDIQYEDREAELEYDLEERNDGDDAEEADGETDEEETDDEADAEEDDETEDDGDDEADEEEDEEDDEIEDDEAAETDY